MEQEITPYDYVIVGSGFGGSVAALRLSEKGYSVLVIEKGKWFYQSDFPETNWNLKKWLWMPWLRCFGIMKISFFRHVTILSGVGVGGGSLVYANTLPVPKKEFFTSGSWKNLRDWENELKSYYEVALRMLGASQNPRLETGDLALKELGKQIGRADHFQATNVSVFFGEPGKNISDPYFNGAGPERAGCIFCGGCMTGCRHNAKNSLDKNYLYLAQKSGARILAESEVIDVIPHHPQQDSVGYLVTYKSSTSILKKKSCIQTKGVVFAGGVMGTVPLLLRLRKKSLPNISSRIGYDIRTNNESLISVTTFNKEKIMSDGIAIGSILHTDKNSHLEPVRYGAGSGFWRLTLLPFVTGKNIFIRIFRMILEWMSNPIQNLKILFVDDWAKRSQVLLFMQHLDSTLRFKSSIAGMSSQVSNGKKPSAFIPGVHELSGQYAKLIDGKAQVFALEPLLDIPSTAHVLGGAVMGESPNEGVIDKNNRVFGYENMMICDGSAISANPGVNPALTITALAEHAMSKIPEKMKFEKII